MRRFVAVLSALLLSAAACDMPSGFEAGVDAFNRGDYATAYKEFLPLAEQGDAKAQFSLGFMYYEGLGVPQSDAQAVEWWRKAAEQGDADAQVFLGFMYDEGLGVPQDYAQAAEWYLKAAEQGDVLSQTNLGFMYAEGRGVPKDDVRAYAWFNLAAAPPGDQEAAEARDALGKSMTAAQVTEAQKLSADLARRLGEGAED